MSVHTTNCIYIYSYIELFPLPIVGSNISWREIEASKPPAIRGRPIHQLSHFVCSINCILIVHIYIYYSRLKVYDSSFL